MKAFGIAMLLMVGITIVANLVLNRMDYSAEAQYAPQNANVRVK